MALADAARAIAGRIPDDVPACAALGESLPEESEVIGGAIQHLAALRTNYLNDRAYRLLTATVNQAPVRPIDPTVRDQFLEEERFGQMSLAGAFARLASLEPRLLTEAPAPPIDRALPRKRRSSWGRSTAPLVGPSAGRAHAVVNSELAQDVVREYRHAAATGRLRDDDPTPFFQLKRRTFGGTLFVIGPDPRSRARN
jgi:hypothetical protein